MLASDVLLLILTGCAVAIRISFHVHVWQRKEYRIDRLFAALSAGELRHYFTLLWFVALAVLNGALLALVAERAAIVTSTAWAVILLFLLDDLLWIRQRGVFRPRPTIKAICVLVISVVVAGSILLALWRYQDYRALGAAMLITVLPYCVAISVVLINLPFAVAKKIVIARAQKLRARLSDLTVIGITGSYGKTSTKYFLQQILHDEPGVAATKEHRNSELAVAQDMLRTLKSDTKYYIAEMGAYRKGEIRALAKLLRPTVGCITAIGNQHVALFGSLKNIAVAKWELVASLPASGTAVLNAADPQIQKKAARLKKKAIWYMSAEQDAGKSRSIDVFLKELHLMPRGSRMTLCIGKGCRQLELALVSEAMIGSCIAAVAAAYAVNIPAERIFHALPHLKPYPRTMQIVAGLNGATVIDDSYSANEAGVLSAIKHLSRFTEPKKIVVLLPLIELGSHANAVHERIGEALAQTQAETYLTNRNSVSSLRVGAHRIDPTYNFRVADNAGQLAKWLQLTTSPATVILLEGRIPDVVRSSVL